MQLPLARDVERLRQILGLQRRLLDMEASPRAKRALMHRGPFHEALTWLDIHGQAPEMLEHWKRLHRRHGRGAADRDRTVARPPMRRAGAGADAVDGGGRSRSDDGSIERSKGRIDVAVFERRFDATTFDP